MLMEKKLTPLAVALAFVPIVACAVAYLFLPETIPGHIGPEGVDRWGSRAEVFVLGGIMTLLNLLMAACFRFAEKLMARGLMHAPNASSGRAILFFGIVFSDFIAFVLLAVWFYLGS